MDKISNLIINIKNASNAKKEQVLVPYSNFKLSIVEVLKKEGYIKSIEKKGKKVKRVIEMGLLYNSDGSPRIGGVKRISKPSKRVYLGAGEIKSVKGGAGLAIISTSKGIMTGNQARKEGLGGEILFNIW